MGQWAIITGASSGIGLELARLFAADGWSVALVARDEARLRSLATELEAQHKIGSRVVPTDLSKPDAANHLFEAMKDVEVSALVNNAGYGLHGMFAEQDPTECDGMVQVNILALMQLTRLFLPAMLARRRGLILNVGSVAAFQPGPTMAVYYASKAFVYSFSYALAAELEGSGVTLTVLNPGTTRTRFFERSGASISRPFPVLSARQVAMTGYHAALKGKRSVTPGIVNRLMSILSPCLPSRLTSSVVAKVHQR